MVHKFLFLVSQTSKEKKKEDEAHNEKEEEENDDGGITWVRARFRAVQVAPARCCV
jgi:hypothetical protein